MTLGGQAEFFGGAGLPDSGLAGEQDDGASAVLGGLQEMHEGCKLGNTPNERRSPGLEHRDTANRHRVMPP